MRRLELLPLGLSAVLSMLMATSGCTSPTPTPSIDVAQPGRGAPEPADIAAELLPVPGPKRPPSVSEKVELPYPPPAPPSKQTQDRPPDGPLQVLRTSPTEKQPGLVGAVTAVFNQGMVPLASVD